MIRFLFWNLNRKPLAERVARIARQHDVDVVAVAECSIPATEMLDALRTETGNEYTPAITMLDTMAVYARFPSWCVRPLRDHPGMRLTMQRLFVPGGSDLLLVLIHLHSKLHWSTASQSQACPLVAGLIRDEEARLGHSRTIVIGDLNMNPFEEGVVSSYGFHATMARDVALRGTRTVLGHECPFFYNPMWGHFGDAVDSPAGTYYDSGSQPVSYFWNIFDQVLVRPSLVGGFKRDELRILDSDGSDPLVTARGIPDSSRASDHLPILFGMDL